MIQTIRHKGLKLFWTKADPSKLDQRYVNKISMVLSILDAAKTLEDLNMPGARLHRHKGKKKNDDPTYSLDVTGNFRILFKFKDGSVYEVDYKDPH